MFHILTVLLLFRLIAASEKVTHLRHPCRHESCTFFKNYIITGKMYLMCLAEGKSVNS